MNEKLVVVDQQLLKTAKSKQQNTDNVLLLVENCDIKIEILYKPIADPDNCDVRVIFCEGFSLVPIIITTIIIESNSPVWTPWNVLAN